MKKTSLIAVLLAAMLAAPVSTAAPSRVVQRDGHHALLVDGNPFLMLGAQAHNSSNFPAALGEVWAAARDMQANIVLMPVTWEQAEPMEGKFEFSFVDTLVKEAHQNKQRLVLLWFATWKNTSAAYTPAWVKPKPKRFPAMLDKTSNSEAIQASMRLLQRKHNAPWIPEIGNAEGYVRWIYPALGRGAIGIAPFSLDYFNYSSYPLGAKRTDTAMGEPFARVFGAFQPIQRQWAQSALEGSDRKPQSLELPGGWVAKLSYRQMQVGELAWDSKDERLAGTEQPGGGVAIAQVGEDEFLIVGQRTRARMEGAPGASGFMLHAEEGRFDDKSRRRREYVWNGDQVKRGLNPTAEPVMLKVTMARALKPCCYGSNSTSSGPA
ncbi:DUF5597 domain-containing protein [Roseateles sp. LYH14W]|uniref:DUF5597 domain-containing protein n=1 Tax=Pelomonas parva TaxID=3299032 RepID=A0ABW7FC06_9BURK